VVHNGFGKGAVPIMNTSKVNGFVQDQLLPILHDVSLPFNEVESYKHGLWPLDYRFKMLNVTCKKHLVFMLKKCQELKLQMRTNEWIQEEFKASEKAFHSLSKGIELDNLLVHTYGGSWNKLMEEHPELKDRPEIYLALCIKAIFTMIASFKTTTKYWT